MRTGRCAGFTMRLTWLTEAKKAGTEEVLYRLGLAAAAAVFLFWAAVRFCPPKVTEWAGRYSFCVIYRFTGYVCPGCGGTRALRELLAGHVGASFLYHPLVPYGIGLYIVFMGSHTWEKLCRRILLKKDCHEPRIRGLLWRDSYLVLAAGILAANFIIKNLIHLLTGMDVLAELDRLFAYT